MHTYVCDARPRVVAGKTETDSIPVVIPSEVRRSQKNSYQSAYGCLTLTRKDYEGGRKDDQLCFYRRKQSSLRPSELALDKSVSDGHRSALMSVNNGISEPQRMLDYCSSDKFRKKECFFVCASVFCVCLSVCNSSCY